MEASVPVFRVGRYVFHRQIAAGGMARVHLGRMRADGGFSPIVAIKRLHGSFVNEPSFVEMFLDEAKLAGRIRHPNVVPVLDVVSTPEELFLVMEYVHGESFSKILADYRAREQRIAPEVAAAIVVGMLQGLHAAHEARGVGGEPLDIVHRDVSPQNVLVGVDGIARLLDFGVAKAVGRLQTTHEGQVKGKLAYMAPEQLRREPVTRQTDVYAASIVLWEALTGERLFRGDSEASVVERVLFADVEAPSTRAPGISAALDQVVMRGLVRERAKRWATAQEMAIALQKAIAPAPAHIVGECVTATAGLALDARMEWVRELEKLDLDRVEPEAPRIASEPTVDVASQVSSISVQRGAAPPAARRTWVWLGGALVLGGALATIATRSFWTAPATEPAPGASFASSAAPSSTTPVAAIATVAPLASSTPLATAAPPPPATTAVTSTKPSTHPPALHTATAAATTAATAEKTCLIPYRSADGIQKYRPGHGAECPPQ